MAALPDELRGARLRLCRWTLEDVDEVRSAVEASFDELHVWMAWAQAMPSRESLVELTKENVIRFESDERWTYWMREIDGGALVGSAGLEARGRSGELEIGYWVRSDRTGRGYATEAARILTGAAFDAALEIDLVRISMDRANQASAAVPPKLGFNLDEEYEREVVTPGHSGSAIAWTIARAAWRERSS
jgi:ribosomal-protein-serine acetyltransferase